MNSQNKTYTAITAIVALAVVICIGLLADCAKHGFDRNMEFNHEAPGAMKEKENDV
jgi:hypothetical protein